MLNQTELKYCKVYDWVRFHLICSTFVSLLCCRFHVKATQRGHIHLIHPSHIGGEGWKQSAPLCWWNGILRKLIIEILLYIIGRKNFFKRSVLSQNEMCCCRSYSRVSGEAILVLFTFSSIGGEVRCVEPFLFSKFTFVPGFHNQLF